MALATVGGEREREAIIQVSYSEKIANLPQLYLNRTRKAAFLLIILQDGW